MQQIIKNLEKEFELLRELAQKREDKFYSSPIEWQKSEKSDLYYDKTIKIEANKDCLQGIITELKELSVE